MLFSRRPLDLPTPGEAVTGRYQVMPLVEDHRIFKVPLDVLPKGCQVTCFGMGCFWSGESRFWTLPGVVNTAVGYQGGLTPNPTYEEVCTGLTGHAETVRVVFDPRKLSYEDLLTVFWESHDPTQGMRQGEDVGTQYRSVIHILEESQRPRAEASREAYGARLTAAGLPAITTEILSAFPFYFAEPHHQQFLDRNPSATCTVKGTGVRCR